VEGAAVRSTMSKENTAYHDAGHGVAYSEYKFNLAPITIIPNKRCAGSLDGKDYFRLDGTVDAKRAGEAIVALLAGYAAEVKYDPASKSQAVIHAGDDFAKAADIIGTLKKLGQTKDIKIWQREADDFVKKHWKAIETVARELLEVKTLDGQSVEYIIEIAAGKDGARESLARWRELGGLPQTRQFPHTAIGKKKAMGR
jgi:ATP-dependent Zn protease